MAKKKEILTIENRLELALDALMFLACNADEDTPSEYRSRHLREAFKDAFAILKREKRT